MPKAAAIQPARTTFRATGILQRATRKITADTTIAICDDSCSEGRVAISVLAVVWLAVDDPNPEATGLVASPARERRPALVSHARFGDDLPRIQEILEKLDSNFDLLEPFGRIRDAIAEARKMGVTSRAS